MIGGSDSGDLDENHRLHWPRIDEDAQSGEGRFNGKNLFYGVLSRILRIGCLLIIAAIFTVILNIEYDIKTQSAVLIAGIGVTLLDFAVNYIYKYNIDFFDTGNLFMIISGSISMNITWGYAITHEILNSGLKEVNGVANLENMIEKNRFTLAVTFPLTGAVVFFSSAEGLLPPPLAFNPFFTVLPMLTMRLPLIVGFTPLLDRKGTLALFALVAYSYIIELIPVRAGWIYRELSSGIGLGPMLFGEVPLGIPLLVVPLILNAYLLVLLLLGDIGESILSRLLATLVTAILSAHILLFGAVGLGFWQYGDGGFYGIPWSSYIGLIVSTTVAVVVLDWGFDHADIRHRMAECEFMLDDLVSFVLLWGSINLFYANWIAVGLAVLLSAGLLSTNRLDITLSQAVLARAMRR